jgi:hypothetical protein
MLLCDIHGEPLNKGLVLGFVRRLDMLLEAASRNGVTDRRVTLQRVITDLRDAADALSGKDAHSRVIASRLEAAADACSDAL